MWNKTPWHGGCIYKLVTAPRLTKGQTTMYSIWIRVNPTTWVETRSRFVEEQQAQEKARQYLGDLHDVRVFVQFDSEPDMQEVL